MYDKKKYGQATSIISISKKFEEGDFIYHWKRCDKIISILKMHKIICSVSENKSIQCDKNDCWIEYGCRITTSLKPELIKKDIFNPLKKALGLGCGHIEVHGDYRGCINKFNS